MINSIRYYSWKNRTIWIQNMLVQPFCKRFPIVKASSRSIFHYEIYYLRNFEKVIVSDKRVECGSYDYRMWAASIGASVDKRSLPKKIMPNRIVSCDRWNEESVSKQNVYFQYKVDNRKYDLFRCSSMNKYFTLYRWRHMPFNLSNGIWREAW